MISAHGSTRNAVRAAIRSVQAQERAAARICPDCGKPLSEDLRARLTVGAIAKTGSRYVSRGRPETDAELDCCACPRDGRVLTAGNAAMASAPPCSPTQAGEGRELRPAARGFRLRTTAHHRTDDEAQRIIYVVIDRLRASAHIRGVAQRVEFHSRRVNGDWLQHIEISGTAEPGAWRLLDNVARRHPGWLLSRE